MLTGILSRRNTASHRVFSRLRALPLSPPQMWICSLLSQKIKKQENTFSASSCKKSLCMTSYDGIIRIRLKGRSWITSSQPADTSSPDFIRSFLYPLFRKISRGLKKSIIFIVSNLFEQIVKTASYCIIIMIRTAYLVPDMTGSV